MITRETFVLIPEISKVPDSVHIEGILSHADGVLFELNLCLGLTLIVLLGEALEFVSLVLSKSANSESLILTPREGIVGYSIVPAHLLFAVVLGLVKDAIRADL